MYFYFHPHTHTHTPLPTPRPHTHTHTLTHTHTHTHPYPPTHTHTHTHPYPPTHTPLPTHPHTHTHTQDAGIRLATAGSLPYIVALTVYGLCYLIIGVVTFVDRISERRLLIYSLVVFFIMVLQVYSVFALTTIPRASNAVNAHLH